jgi:transcriptional regulatory protein LevR
MKRIDLIYEKLKEWTAGENRWVSAKKLADTWHLDRANMLNMLTKLKTMYQMLELERAYNIHTLDDELCYVTEFFDYYKQKQ